jgi:hypothetical protein
MISVFHVFLCSVTALLIWGATGLALGRLLLPASLVLPLAPAFGWAVHSALALPLYRLIGFEPATVALGSLVLLLVAGFMLRLPTQSGEPDIRIPIWGFALAALLAAVPVLALFPKISGEAVVLAGPMFDHSKVAMIDQMTRLGLPPGNPFFGSAGSDAPLAYYYLWHFSAAELAQIPGVSAWEADIALSAFTAFSSVTLMMGFGAWIGGRASAGLWVVPLAFAASLHPVLEAIFGAEEFYSYILPPTGFAGWLFQTTWAPQHIASTSCVLLSALLLLRLAQKVSWLPLVAFALTAAAGYQSSTWVGGILFAISAPMMAVAACMSVPRGNRFRLLGSCGAAALLFVILVYPFLRDQWLNAAARGVGSPVAFDPYRVLDFPDSDEVRRALDVPAFWLMLPMIEFPAIYIPGIVSFVGVLRGRRAAEPALLMAKLLGILALMGLLIAGLFSITFAENNDLGWRAILPAVVVLTIFAAVGLDRWLAKRQPLAAALGLALLALGLPRSFQIVDENLRGSPSASGKLFAATPDLWSAVRRVTPRPERVANNPQFMADVTPWPVNISWALFANRASCYAGRELVMPYSSLSPERVEQIEEQFRRVFDGHALADDLRDLASRYQCRTIVLTPEDGAWRNDPFAKSGDYALAEENPGAWKIYRVK